MRIYLIFAVRDIYVKDDAPVWIQVYSLFTHALWKKKDREKSILECFLAILFQFLILSPSRTLQLLVTFAFRSFLLSSSSLHNFSFDRIYCPIFFWFWIPFSITNICGKKFWYKEQKAIKCLHSNFQCA